MTRERIYKSEADVKKYVKKVLDQYRWRWWMPPMNGFGQTGVSDFNALRAGVFLAVETKFGDNELTTNQEKFLNDVLSEGGFGFVVYETTVETFEKWNELFDVATLHTSKGSAIPNEVGAGLLECARILTEPLALAEQRRAGRKATRRAKTVKRVRSGVTVDDSDHGLYQGEPLHPSEEDADA